MNTIWLNRLLLMYAVLCVGAAVAWGTVFVVNERQLAVVLQFGQPVATITEPRLYFKIPLVQDIVRLPKTKQFWESSASETLVDLPTRDGKKIEVSAWAIWRITDPEKFVRVLRTVDNGKRAVQIRVRSVIRDVITSYDLSEVVRSSNRQLTRSFSFGLPDEITVDSTPQADGEAPNSQRERIVVGRENIVAEIKRKIHARLTGTADDGGQSRPTEDSVVIVDRGIELVDVGISNIGFVASVREAAFERLRAYMESIAAAYENAGKQRKQEILNRTQAEVEKIHGEGEEKSKRIRGEVDAQIIEGYARAIEETEDLYEFVKTLELLEKTLNSQTRLILTTDSELFRLLKEVGSREPTR